MSDEPIVKMIMYDMNQLINSNYIICITHEPFVKFLPNYLYTI